MSPVNIAELEKTLFYRSVQACTEVAVEEVTQTERLTMIVQEDGNRLEFVNQPGKCPKISNFKNLSLSTLKEKETLYRHWHRARVKETGCS